MTNIAVACLQQYDSNLELLDYASADPARFGGEVSDDIPVEAGGSHCAVAVAGLITLAKLLW